MKKIATLIPIKYFGRKWLMASFERISQFVRIIESKSTLFSSMDTHIDTSLKGLTKIILLLEK